MVAIPKQQAVADPIQQVKERVRIEDYAIFKMGYEMTRKGRPGEYWMCCPFHKETTASFHIRANEQDWKCFGCG